MTDVTLQTISPGYQSTNALNNNFSAIQSALADSLSKSQTASNQMSTPLDMNGYQILNAVLTDSIFENIEGVYQDFSLNNNRITNLAPATALTDAVNLSQLNSAISGFSFPVTSVFGRTGTITAQAGDYSASDVGTYTTTEIDTKLSGKSDVGHTHPVADLEQGAGTEGQVPTLASDGSVTWATPPGAGGGESNTALNVGTGSGWYKQKVGSELQFKTVLAGTNVAISAGADEITINVDTYTQTEADAQFGTGGIQDTHSGRTDNPHSVTAAQAGADPAGTAASAVSSHETTYNHTSYDTHLSSTTNPHSVTAAQVGSYTTSEVDTKVSTETVHSAASGAFDRANGGIQTYTLTAAETISVTINEGQSMTLHLSAGATYTVTWPTMTWVGGSAPTLTAADVIEFWKVGTTLYGAYVGSVA